MPEITSVETIRKTLHEFEERVDGAITAAKTLARIKTDAERLLTDIQSIFTKSEHSLQKAEGVRLELQQLQRDWEGLRQQVDEAQTESRETHDLLLSELDAAIQSLGKQVAEAGERLEATNKASLSEQAELLKRLEASTRSNAEAAQKSQSAVTDTAERLDRLLATLGDELRAEVRSKLTKAEKLLESEVERVEKCLEEERKSLREGVESKAANHERLLSEEMSAFKDEMKRNLTEHQQAIDRQLTEFLNKQNVLVQNLSQQIDSFHRVSQAQASELAVANTKIRDLASGFDAYKTTAENEMAALATGLSDLKALLAEVRTGLDAQQQKLTKVQALAQTTGDRLDDALENLKKSLFVGRRFR